ncbi:hypothetical protein BaRGS_00022484 [Batillaria attramentaria]|uniref:Uncharacterized protein n=1 Tax=Batillaria attramentaria TaxID=370345 RepID=A0ABD0KGU4_9CAEN
MHSVHFVVGVRQQRANPGKASVPSSLVLFRPPDDVKPAFFGVRNKNKVSPHPVAKSSPSVISVHITQFFTKSMMAINQSQSSVYTYHVTSHQPITEHREMGFAQQCKSPRCRGNGRDLANQVDGGRGTGMW